MTKHPFINALAAAAYIFLVVWVMNLVTQPMRDKPDTMFAPIAVLFMLTLSVTVMAYLFFYQPLRLFIEGKKQAALNLFAKTLAYFAAFTSVVLLMLFTGWL